jgi:hypothetical protein
MVEFHNTAAGRYFFANVKWIVPLGVVVGTVLGTWWRLQAGNYYLQHHTRPELMKPEYRHEVKQK